MHVVLINEITYEIQNKNVTEKLINQAALDCIEVVKTKSCIYKNPNIKKLEIPRAYQIYFIYRIFDACENTYL